MRKKKFRFYFGERGETPHWSYGGNPGWKVRRILGTRMKNDFYMTFALFDSIDGARAHFFSEEVQSIKWL